MFGYYNTNKIYLARLGICTQGQYNKIKKPTDIYTFVKPTTNSDYRKNYLDGKLNKIKSIKTIKSDMSDIKEVQAE